MRCTSAICACEPTIETPLPESERKSDSSFSTSATSLRSPSCEASVSAGSSTGWWAKTITFLTAGFFSASSSAACSIGSCAQFVPRSVP